MVNSLYPKLRTVLESYGCTFIRQAKGSHEIWRSPINEKMFSLPVTILSWYTANAILKQAGITDKI